MVQTGSGAHPASYAMSAEGFSLGVKQPERDSDHSPSTSAEVKKTWIIHPLPHTSSWCRAELIKQRDNFTFLPFYRCHKIHVKTVIT
jgi:hypothetical protein